MKLRFSTRDMPVSCSHHSTSAQYCQAGLSAPNNEVNQAYSIGTSCVQSSTYVPSGMYIGQSNWAIAIYEWSPVVPVSLALRTSAWTYQGCRMDQGNPRITGAATPGVGQMRVWVKFTSDAVASCQQWVSFTRASIV